MKIKHTFYFILKSSRIITISEQDKENVEKIREYLFNIEKIDLF